MSTLQRAIEIAVEAHKGQVDKAGAPYLLHPLRVMLRLETDAERIVGVLHDVVEDCGHLGWTFERLTAEGFSADVLGALRSVTKTEEEQETMDAASNEEERDLAYWTFVARAIRNPIGKRVKLADLADNCDLSRIAAPTEKDRNRIARYHRVIARIRDGAAKG